MVIICWLARFVFTKLPYPIGLFVPKVGPVVANDAYVSPQVRENFQRDEYHSPRTVWGERSTCFSQYEAVLVAASQGLI